MSERKPGFYWVRFSTDPIEVGELVSEKTAFCDEPVPHWHLTHAASCFKEVEVLSKCLTPPKEKKK